MSRPLTTATVAAAALALAACSGSSAVSAPAAAGPSSAHCDLASLGSRAGVAAGAVTTYVWEPYRAGTFEVGAQGRRKALATAAAAAHRAERELTAVTGVEGCTSSVPVADTVSAARDLARSVRGQLTKGKVDAEALGGLDSAMTTLVTQAREAGATVTVSAPAGNEVAAG